MPLPDLTPLLAAGEPSTKQAYFQVIRPRPGPHLSVRFNPSEYQIQKANTFAEINIFGIESPPIQFVRGGGEKLTIELLADTSDTMTDVRERYVTPLRDLMRLAPELHAPPICQLVWDADTFRGVLESLTVSYTLFNPDGVPVRAKLGVSLHEYRPVALQIKESLATFAGLQSRIRVEAGAAIDAVAAASGLAETDWRLVARANPALDPRGLAGGAVVRVPTPRFGGRT